MKKELLYLELGKEKSHPTWLNDGFLCHSFLLFSFKSELFFWIFCDGNSLLLQIVVITIQSNYHEWKLILH